MATSGEESAPPPDNYQRPARRTSAKTHHTLKEGGVIQNTVRLQVILLASHEDTHFCFRILLEGCYVPNRLSILNSFLGLSRKPKISDREPYLQSQADTVDKVCKYEYRKWGCRTFNGIRGDLEQRAYGDRFKK